MKRLLATLVIGLCLAGCGGGSTTSSNEVGADAEVVDVPGDLEATEAEMAGPVCGDQVCTKDLEDCGSCPEDCGECCGNGACDDGEECGTCPQDCGPCPDLCPNGTCDAEETCGTCPVDCGACCGNEKCEAEFEEDCQTCPADCGQCCGNGTCEAELGETCTTCPADCTEGCEVKCGDEKCDETESCKDCPDDCGECCGNGVCEQSYDENCGTCPDDCGGECPVGCPDGTCDPEKETCSSCPQDCGSCCPNEKCEADLGEDCLTCEADCGACPPVCGDELCETEKDETCATCELDCGKCEGKCGDGVPNPDAGEECDDGNIEPDDGCDETCKVEPEPADPGDVIITEILKDPAVLGADADQVGEWFEVYNTTDHDIDMNAWWLKDDGQDKHRIFAYGGVVVSAGESFVFGRNGDPAVNGGYTPGYVYKNFSLSNKDDEVVLWSGDVVVDAVKYDDGATFPDEPGKSLTLSPEAYDGTDNDVGANWCSADTTFGAGDFGTPGEVNPDCEWPAECGDGECNGDEDCVTCPDDCTTCVPVCGDGKCETAVPEELKETCQSCPADCGECCGNGTCDTTFGENCDECPADCDLCCGNGKCEPQWGETVVNCPDDCAVCPDGTCNEPMETCATCEADCGKCCGDGTCDPAIPETPDNCPADCVVCKDGKCNGYENCSVCPQDCGACCPNGTCEPLFGETAVTCPADCVKCGDGQCNGAETIATCPADCVKCGDGQCTTPTETCTSCAADCGACPTGDCKVWGTQGATYTCAVKLAAESAASPKATGIQFNAGFDATKISGVKIHTTGGDIPPGSSLPGGQGALVSDQGGGVWKIMIYANFMAPDVPVSQAYMSGGNPVGDPKIFDLVFTLSQTVAQANALAIAFTELKATDKDGKALTMKLTNGIFVTSAGAAAVCGDGTCNGTETAATCPADCVKCGDGQCNGAETIATCPADCVKCGDGQCTAPTETLANCPADCAKCGDGQCTAPAETCTTCPSDCGACPTGECKVWGTQGTTYTCAVKLAAESAASPKATGMQFNVGIDASKISGVKIHTTGGDIPPGSSLPTGQGALVSDQGGGVWKIMVYANFMAPDVPISQAYMSGGNPVGDPKIFELVFTLSQTVTQANAVAVSFTELKATDKDGVALKMVLTNGIFVTSKQ